jgi:NADH-quinone oxidoreductase subunit N
MTPTLEYFLLPVSPVLTLLGSGSLLVLLEVIFGFKGRALKYIVALAGTLISLGFAMWLWKNLPPSSTPLGYYGNVSWLVEFAQSYSLTPLSLALYVGIGVLTALSLVFLNDAFSDSELRSEVFILVTFVASGMMLLVSANSLLMVFLALELLSLPTYVLVGIHRKDRASCEAALKYFLFGSFASVLLVFGIALLYAQFGTLRLTQIAEILRGYGPGLPVSKTLILAGMSLILIASAFKIGIVPFHMWLPDVYQGAPTAITGFMGSAIKLAGFGLATRLLWEMFLPITQEWTAILGTLAVITMFVGNIAALTQDNLKRMFAYSSISHAGYLLLGVAAVGKGGPVPAALFYYLMVYGLMFVGLFAILAIVERATGNTEIYSLSGFGFSHPVLGLCLALFAISGAGIPPTAGFLGKYFIFLEAVRAGRTWWVVFAVISSVIGAYYYLRVVVYLYMKDSKEKLVLPAMGKVALVCVVACAVSLLYFAVMPTTLGLESLYR